MRRVQKKVRTGTEETVKESDSGRRPFINRVGKTLFNIRLLQFLVICIIIMSYGVIVMLVCVLIAVIGKYLHNNSDLFSRYSSDKKRKGTPVSGNKIAREEGDLFPRYSSDKKRKGTPVSGNKIAGEEGDLFLRYSSDKKRKGTPVSGNKIADCEETKKDFVDKVLELLTNHETVVTESHCDYRGIHGFDTYTKLLELLTTQVEAVPENCKRHAKERIVINVIAVLKNPGVKAVLKIDWGNGERETEGIMREVQNVVRTGTEETVNESDSDCEGIDMEYFVTEVLVLLRKQSILGSTADYGDLPSRYQNDEEEEDMHVSRNRIAGQGGAEGDQTICKQLLNEGFQRPWLSLVQPATEDQNRCVIWPNSEFRRLRDCEGIHMEYLVTEVRVHLRKQSILGPTAYYVIEYSPRDLPGLVPDEEMLPQSFNGDLPSRYQNDEEEEDVHVSRNRIAGQGGAEGDQTICKQLLNEGFQRPWLSLVQPATEDQNRCVIWPNSELRRLRGPKRMLLQNVMLEDALS